MRESDFEPFAALLRDVAALIPPQQALTPTQVGLYFRALEPFGLAQVSAAMTAHVRDPQRGRFFPRPADVIAQLEGLAADDGRPGADEAWAVALRGMDEADTIVWTVEMAQAWGISKPVLDLGDDVGARIAFRDAYNRLVDEARRTRRPCAWALSEGHDPQLRDAAIQRGVASGLLEERDHPQLPAPAVLSLEDLSKSASAPQDVRDRLRSLREALERRADSLEPSHDLAEKLRTGELKEQATAAVRDYCDEHGIQLEEGVAT